MRNQRGYVFKSLLVLAGILLLMVLSSCRERPPQVAEVQPTPTERSKHWWVNPTFTPDPAKAHFTPTPTSLTMQEVAEEVESERQDLIADYTEAVEADPTDADAYAGRGMAYAELNELEKALVDLDKAIELDPDFGEAYAARGQIHAGERNLEEAIADFTRAITLDPNFARVYYNRGMALQNIGKRKDAAQDFVKYLELEPDAPEKAQLKQMIKIYGG